MQSSIVQPMLVSLLTSVNYDKNKLQNRTGQLMLLSLPTSFRYGNNKMLLR